MKTRRVLLGFVPALMMVAACEDDTTGPNDVTSPVRVTSLTVVSAGDNNVTLQWTAPGDDGGSGTATSYQVRWSLAPINSANFGVSNVAANPPAPAVGGTVQQFIVPGIDTTLVTHFALRAFDEAGNGSQVSNDAVWTPGNTPLHLTKDIPAFKDNTMYEESANSSNGAGEYLFTGQTLGLNSGGIGKNRRALLAFAIADSIPAGAVVDSVRLTVHISNSANDTLRVASLHRVTSSWGEGASDAGAPGGAGIAAETNDATWVYRFFNTDSWTSPGGDFAAAPSAQTMFGDTNSFSAWASLQMTSDVQNWLNAPANNHGWLVIGDESGRQTAKRIDSSENATPANRPRLRVFYTVVP